MTSGLKTTIVASTALAGLLNIVQFGLTHAQQAQSAFVPSWMTPAPSPAPANAATTLAPNQPAASQVAAPPASVPPAAADPVAAAGSKLGAAGLRADFAANYLKVQGQTGVPWQLLAAVHKIETNQSGDTARSSYAGATGPMQFMPATFAHYALDGDGDGARRITDFDDALLTAGRYLAAGGAGRGQYRPALYNYNHSVAYVNKVLSIAGRLGL